MDPILVNLMRNESPLKLNAQVKNEILQDESAQQSYRQEMKEALQDF